MIRRRNIYRLACVVLAGFAASAPGRVSSQIDEGPQHPASSEAALAPLSPIGEALSSNDVPAPAGADAPSGAPEHQHGSHSGAAQSGSPSGASPSGGAPSGGEASEPPM